MASTLVTKQGYRTVTGKRRKKVGLTKKQAIDRYGGGNVSKFARRLHLTPQAVAKWPEGQLSRRRTLQCWGLSWEELAEANDVKV